MGQSQLLWLWRLCFDLVLVSGSVSPGDACVMVQVQGAGMIQVQAAGVLGVQVFEGYRQCGQCWLEEMQGTGMQGLWRFWGT